ncbi:MAG: fibro-slime domain-containing protein [Fibrobacter sp.]|nr:fibro-slime domain-containing protein [Fibrobacter sp.]
MKNTKNTLLKWILGACMLVAGVQSAFALQCEGTIFIKVPKTWTMVTLEAGGMFPELKVGTSGWYEAKAASVGQGTSFRVNSAGTHYPAQWIDRRGYDIANNESLNTDAFTCEDLEKGDLYIYEDPTTPGKTAYGNNPPNAKYLYVMVPPDKEDWMSSVPMISMDGGVTGKPLAADADKCGWYTYVWFNEEISDNVVLFRDDDPDRLDMIGLYGNSEDEATPIPLNTFFETYGVNTLYFVPDVDQWLDPADEGWYMEYPEGVEGTCSYTMAAIIYDTDAKLHPAFSCYSQGDEGCQTGALGVDQATAVAAVNRCIGVTPGIVEPTLDPATPQQLRKPKLSTFGKQCFINDDLFNSLFNYTKGVNEKSCYDMPFSRSSDGKWEFDSDFNKTLIQISATATDSLAGGFYPVENSTDESILAADPTQTPVAAARTKRAAEGAIFYGPVLRENDPKEGIPVIDLLCNGPGWKGGYDCSGIFADGDATDAFIKTAYPAAECVIGWSCPDKAPKGWQFYKASTQIKMASGSPRWSGMRNQHYCFESHAKFTQKPGLKFNFRGDDDIWVFIDNKLAVDLGGTHLAAPGYVDLDNFEGLSGKLETGNQYDLDIFFCDRRTTMSNVRIKTNMYIMQKVDITAKAKPDPNDPKGGKIYEMCYTKSGDGSCASAMTGTDEAVTCCGSEIETKCGVKTQYLLIQGTAFDAEAGRKLTPGQMNLGGIDLTDPTSPKIYAEKLVLGQGTYTLYVVIDGKHKKIQTFRTKGKVDVVPGDAVAYDTAGVALPGGAYTFVGTAMGMPGSPTIDDMVPIYVSAITGDKDKNGNWVMQPDDATGMTYTLDIPEGMTIYQKDDAGNLVMVTPGEKLSISAQTGVDTVFAYVSLMVLSTPIQTFPVKVTGGAQIANINIFLPTLSFVDEEGNSFGGMEPNGDGTFKESYLGDAELWLGTYYNFYLEALKPNADGTYSSCGSSCNFTFSLGSETSEGLEAQTGTELVFVDGKAQISIRSSKKEFRWDTDPAIHNPASIVIVGENPLMKAVFSPVYFRKPPVPFPQFADIFDTKGSTPAYEFNIPSPYFSMSQEYLDGIADSVAIYYDRPIHKDSLPTMICFLWDSTSAEKINPVELGFSNQEKDTELLCNAYTTKFSAGEADADGYCSQVVTVSDVKLSVSPKTYGSGFVHSYAVFKDKNKEVKQGFKGALVDRIAPIPLSAEVRSLKNKDGTLADFDSLVITMSEPVKLLEGVANTKNVMDFYLNSAIELAETDRFASAIGGSSTIIEANAAPVTSTDKNGNGRVKLLFLRGGQSPHVGDYVRLGGNLATILWSDATEFTDPSQDSLRGSFDVNYHWNSPTGYDEKDRLPSPWIEVIGDAEITVKENKFANTGNSKATDKDPPVVVYGFPTIKGYAEILADENIGGIPGHFVKADMFSLYNGLSGAEQSAIDPSEVYFYYKVEYYTNLGAYVAGQSGKIYCDDAKNKVPYFNGGKCTDAGNGRNFYIGWNMRSDNGRQVGTGAYIAKIDSYVKLGKHGKEAKQNETSVWGVRKSATPNTDYLNLAK